MNRYRNRPLPDGIAYSTWFDVATAFPNDKGMLAGCKPIHFCDIKIDCSLYPLFVFVTKAPAGVRLDAGFRAASQSADGRKMTNLPKRSLTFGVGKEIGGAVYVHRSYLELLPKIALECSECVSEKLIFSVVKYSEKANTVSFINSPDFDDSSEPVVGDLATVTFDGKITMRMRLADPYIYHHKWLFVKDDYFGFDVEESKRRSLSWLGIDGIDKKRIGRLSYWTEHVIPRIESPTSDWLTSREMAAWLKVSGCELSHLRRAGKLKFKKRGTAFYYYADPRQAMGNRRQSSS